MPTTVLSLYNTDPFDLNDYYDPFGHRLLAQNEGSLQQVLAPGTYFVAVSGTGNRYFSPYLPGSGYAGHAGPYELLVRAAGLGLGHADGPRVLAADPAPSAILDSSPLMMRVNFSAPLDPGTINLGDNVQLTFNPRRAFGNDRDQPIDLTWFNMNTAGNELQLQPSAPLAPGFYRLHLSSTLAGLPGSDGAALALGATAQHPQGRDFWMTFQVSGVEGRALANPDDTPDTAHVLVGGLVQVAGAIGDDSTDPVPFNPADVDFYQFSIQGPGKYALTAEAFARRIGSPLDVGLSLFQLGADGLPRLLAASDNSLNDTPGTNGTLPLFSDAVLFSGLTAGTYYLAVSSHDNVPDPLLGLFPGTEGVFDPGVSHSGANGSSTGAYVLNLAVQADSQQPWVVAATPAKGAVLHAPPTELVIRFSEAVNLRALAFHAFQQISETTLTSVYIQGAGGSRYFPRLQSWDEATHTATFLMLDGLPNGDYQLRLSGSLGLADYAGNPLVGNEPSGDHVVPFSVAGPQRGSAEDPLLWPDLGGNNDPEHAQVLGVLFPHELQAGAGVTISRVANAGPGKCRLFPVPGPAGPALFLRPGGHRLERRRRPEPVRCRRKSHSRRLQWSDLEGRPAPGEYVVRVGGWSPDQGESVAYQLRVTLGGADENPTPLTMGPAPVLRIRLSDLVPGPAVAVPTTTVPRGNTSTDSMRSSFLKPFRWTHCCRCPAARWAESAAFRFRRRSPWHCSPIRGGRAGSRGPAP